MASFTEFWFRWINFLMYLSIFELFIILRSVYFVQGSSLVSLSPDVILRQVDSSCVVGISHSAYLENTLLFDSIDVAFRDEEAVMVGIIEIKNFKWNSDKQLRFKGKDKESEASDSFVIFPRRQRERTCLLQVAVSPPVAEVFTGNLNADSALKFINSHCITYRTLTGQISVEGLHRKEILDNLFHVVDISDVSMGKIHSLHNSTSCPANRQHLVKKRKSESDSSCHVSAMYAQNVLMPQCDKIPLPTKNEFFHKYLKLSKPVIIKDAMKHWKAMKKWTNEYFRANYGDRTIHVKLTPAGEYEGVESARLFDNYETFKVPIAVQSQLKYPDLVVVRPATANLKLKHFLDLIESVAKGEVKNMSAYLEYSSIADITTDLEADVEEVPLLVDVLERKHLNIWLSDGNTLGKLHFDPFDNFLCQISGRKQVILFEPYDNTRLYEAHIPEAMLSFNMTDKTFRHKELVDSTSMVMSPVDILKPDFQRFPRLAETYPLNCTIDEGEVLFMPAFWWHEVQSFPNTQQGRNLAVNFWYDPFLVKEFPCPECKLDINPKYRHLL